MKSGQAKTDWNRDSLRLRNERKRKENQKGKRQAFQTNARKETWKRQQNSLSQ